MANSRNELKIAVVVAALSGCAFYLGSGLHPLWFMAWVAPIPVLWASPRISGFLAFCSAFVACAAGGMNMWHYLHGVLRVPAVICILVVIGPALFFAMFTSFFRARLRRGTAVSAVLGFPAAWVTFEYVSYLVSVHGTYGSVAYTQLNFLPILQLAAVTGIWGISFTLMLFAASVAILATGGLDAHQKRAALTVATVFLAVSFGYGVLRIHVFSSQNANVTVGLISSDLPKNLLAEKREDALRLLQTYADYARTLASRGARVMVLPEKIVVAPDAYISDVDNIFGTVARDANVWIVVGLIHPTPTAKWNEARVYSPTGTVAAAYEKHHMLPPYESSFTIGTERTLLPQTSGIWGVQICKDMDFPRLSRDYGRDAAGLLLVPAWDFTADGWLHGRMAVMRGVESGFSIARAPKQGILTVTDDRGRVIAERRSDSGPVTTLLARVSSQHQSTLYDFLGDWFAWLCVAILFANFVLLCMPELGEKRSDAPPGIFTAISS